MNAAAHQRPQKLRPATCPELQRLKLKITGAVQGVGFRPFVFHLAGDLGLTGWITNSAQGITIEAEGPSARLNEFLLRLDREKPPRSFIQSMEPLWLDAAGHQKFEIRESTSDGTKHALVLPDFATCPECVRDIFDPRDRRYRYPFTNCTHCGPRFSIIEALPYDRSNTSMLAFTMCPECEAEYHNPSDRRFHAQPNACPTCGPALELWDAVGRRIGSQDDALRAAAKAILAGQIVAIKGIGGFHLFTDASSEASVQRLRERKHRNEKPFALMFPNLESIRGCCELDALEERLLTSAEAPIVLLRRRDAAALPWIAPGNPCFGVMLPYTPLHHLLMDCVGQPVVATSGNSSDEPICTDEREALGRLRGIADLFLVHNRRIVRHVDDSVVRVVLGREMILRRARGYAPLPIPGVRPPPNPVLAVGAHLKNTVALTVGPNVIVSQHIGDLETEPALNAFRRVTSDLQCLFESRPNTLACDAHPDYGSSRFARQHGTSAVAVQHHYAHVLSCMAENELDAPVLGVAWDGTGYGLDGTIWGGEFLLVNEHGFERFASLRPFRLPGGDHAAREPRRAGFGLLHERLGNRFQGTKLPTEEAFTSRELPAIRTMLARGIYSPYTTSMGRLFDAVASITGLRQRSRFEGQAAMELEFSAARSETTACYGFRVRLPESVVAHSPRWIIDWAPMLDQLLEDVASDLPIAEMAAKFHNTLARMIVAVAKLASEACVALSGGCFQNRLLTERAVHALRDAAFKPYWHQRIPPNDGGIALGQVMAASRANAKPTM